MKNCRTWRKRIPEAVYGDLDTKTRGELDRHLASCGKCSGLYQALAKTVRQMSVRPAPDREPEFWEGFWDRLGRRMAFETEGREGAEGRTKASPLEGPTRRHSAFSVRRWALGAAGAAFFLALGIFLGRSFFGPRADLNPAARVTSTETSRPGRLGPGSGRVEPQLALRASRYLRRSRVILLAVVNADPSAGDVYNLSLPLQKKSSEELAQEAAVLKKELRRSDPRLERLVSDLELILLQIANLRPEADVSAVEFIKAGIESSDIFFKIDLSEVRRSHDGEGPGGARGLSGLGGKARGLKTAV